MRWELWPVDAQGKAAAQCQLNRSTAAASSNVLPLPMSARECFAEQGWAGTRETPERGFRISILGKSAKFRHFLRCVRRNLIPMIQPCFLSKAPLQIPCRIPWAQMSRGRVAMRDLKRDITLCFSRYVCQIPPRPSNLNVWWDMVYASPLAKIGIEIFIWSLSLVALWGSIQRSIQLYLAHCATSKPGAPCTLSSLHPCFSILAAIYLDGLPTLVASMNTWVNSLFG